MKHILTLIYQALAKPFVKQRLGTASPSKWGHSGALRRGGRTCGEPQRVFASASYIITLLMCL